MASSPDNPGFVWPPGDGDGDDDACCSVLVFSPANPGPLAANVFDDWLDLVTAAGTIEGRKLIQIDPTFDPTPTIPTGSHLLNQSEIWAEDQSPLVVVDCVDGCELLECLGFSGGIEWICKSDTPIVPLLDGQVFFIRRSGGILSEAGRAPFINVGGAGDSATLYLIGGQLFTGGAPCVGIDGAGGNLNLEVEDNGVIRSNTLTNVVGSTFVIQLQSDQVDRGPTFPPKVSRTQTSVSGAFLRWMEPDQSPYRILDATVGVVLQPVAWYHAIAAAGGNTFLLFPAIGACGPIEIDLKDLLGASITITATGGDTIDGGAPNGSIVVGPGTPAGEAGVTLKSDGAGKWRTFCCAFGGGPPA